MNRRRGLMARIDRVDHAVSAWMASYGHLIERVGLSIIFLWFGLLKVQGHESATSIIAKTVYLSSPKVMVPLLGFWEALIGVCFLFRRLVRAAIVLLLLRIVGSVVALIVKPDECFVAFPWIPTIQGQYLIKDIALFGAALVIGATVRQETGKGHWL